MVDKCSACERDFERLKDYPIVYVASFNRVEIPELMGGSFSRFHPETKSEKYSNDPIPKAVRKLFQETGKNTLSHKGVIYQKVEEESSDGLVWYRSSRDITEVVKSAISKVQESLSALEGFVGQEILTKELLALPGFKERLEVENYKDLSLSFEDIEKTENGLMTCRINLNGGWIGDSPRCASLSQDLAEMSYEGRIKKPFLQHYI